MIKKICIKHPNKKRDAPAELFTSSREELLNDNDINVIVEVIDDAASPVGTVALHVTAPVIVKFTLEIS